jgi:hypothetical protein
MALSNRITVESQIIDLFLIYNFLLFFQSSDFLSYRAGYIFFIFIISLVAILALILVLKFIDNSLIIDNIVLNFSDALFQDYNLPPLLCDFSVNCTPSSEQLFILSMNVLDFG